MINKNNIDLLSPALLDKIKTNKNNSIQFKESKDGLPVPMINKIFLHSTYYPLKEAERVNISEDEKKLCIAIGFGAGYHLTNLPKQNKKVVAIPIIGEALSDVLEQIDLSKWFNKDNLQIISEDEIVNYFDFFRFSSFYFIIHPALEKLFPQRVREIVSNVVEYLRVPMLEMNTQRKLGKLWFKNILNNIKYYLDNNYNFEPLTIGTKPILVTGAGPSLLENIKIIQQERDKLFIATTDTSLKILNYFKIIPDAVFSFDAQHYSYLHYVGIKKMPRLFTDITSPVRLKIDQTILFSNHPIVKVFKKSGWNPVYLPSETRNIGSAIISFFNHYFKDHPLVTAGIDYGVLKNYLYSRGSYIDEYININSHYFNTTNSQQSKLLYRDTFSKTIDDWKTTLLFEEYAKSYSTNKIYSLSSSPFTYFKRIESLQELIEQSKKIKEKTLIFEKPDVSKKDFTKILTGAIIDSPEVLDSYFLSIGKRPDVEEIYKIIRMNKL